MLPRRHPERQLRSSQQDAAAHELHLNYKLRLNTVRPEHNTGHCSSASRQCSGAAGGRQQISERLTTARRRL